MHLTLLWLLPALVPKLCYAAPQQPSDLDAGPDLAASALEFDLHPPLPLKPLNNSTGLGLPLHPDERPGITLEHQYIFPVPVLPGQLLHNLFFTVTTLWRRWDDTRIAAPIHFRFPIFPRLRTNLIPVGGSRQDPVITQLGAAWAVDRAIIEILSIQAWRLPSYSILENMFKIGDLSMRHDLLSDSGEDEVGANNGGQPLNATSTETYPDVLGDVLLPHIRVQTRYMAQQLTPQSVLYVYWQLFRTIWDFAYTSWTWEWLEAGQTQAFKTQNQRVHLVFEMVDPGSREEPFTFTELLDGILKILETPARDDNWHGLEGLIFRHDHLVARLRFVRLIGLEGGVVPGQGAASVESM